MSTNRGGIVRLALLLALAAAAMLLFSASPAAAQPAIIDYDVDNDGLIDVDSLAKLNAIRWDLNGDGLVAPGDQASYAAAFPNPEAGMGCKPADHDDSALTPDQPVCTGYELTADLDFNTNTTTDVSGEAVIDSSDDYWNAGKGWSPIGSESAPYMAVFDGGRHTIANLFINRPTSDMVQFRDVNKSNYVGFFASLMSPGEIRHLRLTGVSVTGRANVGAVVGHITLGKVSHVSSTGAVSAVGNSGGDGQKAGGLVGSTGASAAVIEYSYSTATSTAGDDYAGGLIGENKGIIRASYATGAVTATDNHAGGLAGSSSGNITASYANGAAQGENEVGGLAGSNSGTITASYATGAVSSTDTPAGSDLGGLTGTNTGTVTNGYWDTTTSGQAGGVGKTTSELQTPTAYGSSPSIYADWNVNTDGVAGADDPWDFGTASQYPALKADFDGDGTPTAYEFGRQGRSAPVDYDADNDNLIDVDTLAQLNAMRWDLDGDGTASSGDESSYEAAFPDAAAGMGCAATCIGYELTVDLNFNTNTSTDVSGEAVIDSKDAYWNGGAGWSPIGTWSNKFRTTFDGAGHSISNLHINRSSMDYAGLFGIVGAATIRNLGLNDVNVVGKNYIGTVAGTLSTDATIDTVYVTGSVRGALYIGGVIGELYQPSRMRNVYNAAAVTATSAGGGGGLTGYIPNYTAAVIIRDSYSFGLISGADTGGLSSIDSSIITHTQTYWDTQVSGQAANRSGGVGKTTSELQAPTSKTEDMDDATVGVQNIYSGWDAAVWDFGTASQYPALKYDTDGDGTATWQEFGRQGRSAPVDYDTDNDNLIEITTLAQLNALRWDLNGDGSVASSDQANYETAFPSPAAGMGCHATCAGYELEADLDFNTDTTTDVSGEAVIDDQDAYWNSGSGWVPIGADSSGARYNTVFKGNGHTISNLFIDRSGTSDVGLFGATGTSSEVRMVGLEGVNVTGQNYVGGLAGTGRGDFRFAYTTGSVSSVGNVGDVGGLVGYYDAAGKAIAASYSTARVTGSGNYQAGGLVGEINDGTVLASYATGAVTATENVGGLVGFNKGAVVGSYATGAVTGTTAVGGLVGYRSGSGSATNSYWDTTTSGQANSDGGVGKATSDLQTPTAYGSGADIYANWNVDLDNADNDNDRTSGTDDPWDFGTSSQYPALKADFDGDGRATAYEFGRQGRSAPLPVDYDTDNDGLIDITTLAQLNALRWDLDGDGTASSGDEFSYGTAFHNPKAGMGCKLGDHDDNAATPNQPVCIGYELEMSLDFNTDTTTDVSGEAVIDDQDDYWNGGAGWNPIGNISNQYSTVFEGNGHTISNLFINRPSTDGVGLFSDSGADSEIRRVGLEDVDVTGKTSVGGLAGNAAGAIRATYTNGTVTGTTYVGGLVGFVVGSAIRLSYSNAAVTATVAEVGGLVGHLHGGSAVASYATGSVTGENSVGGLAGTVSDSSIVASYATGVLTGTTNVGGLLGKASGSTITNSYWDTTTSGQSNSAGGGAGKTTSQLQTPVAYGSGSDIYADWNVNTDGVAGADDPWGFGTSSQYPALKADFDGDGRPTAYEFGRQGRSAPLPVDYDTDNDGLIDITTLAQLNAMRWDLDGNGVSTSAGYTTAFPNPEAGMGCKPADHDDSALTPDQPVCTGYELTADLDFNTDTTTDVSGEAVIDDKDAYWNGGSGWEPIGADSSGARYNTVFAGNGHTISNLFINRSGSNDVGLFGATGTSSEVRMVGLVDANVTGQSYVGGLVGTGRGDISFVYITGSVSTGGGFGYIGGLVGYYDAAGKAIAASYSTARVTTIYQNAGGLVGELFSGTVLASYATGAVTATENVGGLVGYNRGAVVGSYATGAVTGTTDVGGLVGYRSGSGSVTNSYWDTTTTGQANSAGGGAGKTTSQLQTPTAYGSSPSIYANWNVDVDGVAGADDPWGFGTASQYPALKVDFDGDGTPTAYEFGRQGRSAPLPVDYDADDDNLIDVNTLAQLNAMRWDLDGDGVSANAGYTTAFPNPAAGMGCPATCTGYELETDLDFDQNNDDTITSIDSAYWNGGSGWDPIGRENSASTRYNAIFEGNGHTISNLFINRTSTDYVGLFGATGASSEVRMVGLEDVAVTGRDYVGGLAGRGRGDIRSAYTTGSVAGVGGVGGLVGDGVFIEIRLSYSNAAVTATGAGVGGLVGTLDTGPVTASYATGAVTATENVGGLVGYVAGGSIVASYATGVLTGTTNVGGLLGASLGSAVTNSYWDTVTTGQANSAGGGAGKTTSQLQTPTAYGSSPSIYANWNVDVDGVAGADDPWGFGTGSQYPALKADFDGDGTPTAYEFGRQGRSAPTNLAPAFATATGSRSVAENTAAGQNIGNPITAADPDVGDTLNYSLGTTADDGHFAIVAASGQLQTKDPLDYESTTSYTVTVTATDGDGLTDTVTVTINVTDVDEPPPAPGQLNVVPDVGLFYFNWQAAPAADMVGKPPVTAYEVQYRKRISTGPDVWEDWTDHAHPVGELVISATIRDLIPGETYGMRARAKNHEGESPWSLPVTGVPNPYANTAPGFTEGATATRSVAENTATGQDIGNPVAAADVNAGDTLIYSLRGTDASHFQLDTATGQLQTKGALDYEGKASYQVIVRVTDGKDRNDANSNVIDDTITVTIEVTDVNEPPTAAPSNVGVASAPLGLEVTWTAPSAGAGRPPVNGYDVRYRRHSVGGVGAWQDHNHRGANARARIRGLNPGDTYGVEVRAKNHEGTGPFSATASGQAGAAPSGVDYDDDDDGLIEVDSLEQLNAIRWNPNGDGVVTAAHKDAYEFAFPGPALGMGCPAADHDDDVNTPDQPTCTGYELNKDLDFNTDTFTDNDDGAVIDSSDAYWNGGLGWEPIRFYGTFEGNRYTISNLFINRPDRDDVGLFSRLGFPYTWRNQIYRVGLENVQVTGGERVGALAGEAHAFIHDSYSTGSVSGAGIVGGLLGKLTVGSVIVSSYSDANVFGTLDDSRHAGGLVGWAGSDSMVRGSFATGDVSAPQANGGLVGSNFGNIIASYARGELDFGIGNQDPWDFDEPFKANGVGGLVGNNWGTVKASYSTGGHPLYMKLSPMSYPIKGSPYYNPRIQPPDRSFFGYEPGDQAAWEKAVRETYDGGENNYRADYFWHIGGLVGDSALGTETDSYWDVDASDHPVSGIRDPDYYEWHRGEGLTTAELQSPTGYSGIYADWNVDIDGDGIADDPWDFGTGSRYPILKADWDGDGTATSQEFDAQTTLQVTAQSSARAIGAEGIMVGVAENTAPGTDISDPFGAAEPETGDALTYSLGGDDAGHFSIDSATGQLRTKGALDYEDKSSYSVTVIATDGDGQTTDIQVTIIVTNVADTPPGQPDAPEIINVKETSFRTTWTAPAAGSSAITGYGIQYKLASAEDSAYADVKPAPTGTGTGYNVVNRSGQTVAEGTSYDVRVRARNTEGWGPWSAAATVTTDGVAASPPGQPAAPEIINVKETSFRITWTAPAAGSSAITGYGIQYKPVSAADAAYADVKPTPTGTGTGYNVVNRSGQTVASGTSYAVRVRASNAEGWGPWSDAAFAVTVGAAPAPINQAPAFAAATATVSVAENTAANTNIGSPVKAADPDGDTLTYTLGTTADDGHFAIDSASGQLQTQGALDYEGKASYSVTVTATDGGGLSASIQVTIDVTDVNEAPAFAAATATVSVAENTAANTNIGSPVTAADPDDGDTLIYTLGTTVDDGHFVIDSASGQLQTKGALDYEGTSSYSVTVTATDGGGLSASIGVTITVTDVADTPPGQPAAPEIINVQQTSFRVTWTAPTVGSSPITGYGIQYKLTSAEDSAYADVKPTPTGIVTGYNLVNRSGQTVAKGTSYTVRVRARNTEGWGPWSEPAVAATAGAAPAPANQAPAFAAATATVSVAENTAANTNIGSPVTAADPDDGDTLTYTLGTTADDGHFAIDSVTGQLRTKGALDYEGKASYSVTVTATDGGGLSASIGVTITVTDVADTPPGQPAAPEIINVKETSFRITWTAPTVGSSPITGYGIQYKLTSAEDSAYADVKPTPTGIGTGYNLVNRNGQTVAEGTSYDVRVRASNAEGWGPWSEPAVAATAGAAPAPINQAPAFAAATVTVSVAENTAANTNIGSPVTAADPDDGDTLTYTLGTTADDGHFAIDSASGQLQTKGALDYEGKASYSVTVTATDGGGLSASIGVTITVTDVADTPPGQPAAPEIINVKETSFRITWTAPAEGSSAITGYGIQYKLASAEDSAYADVKPTPTGIGTGYNLVNRNGQTVAEGTSYDVRVRASNAEGWGPWSEPAVAATAGAAESDEGGSESGDYQATAFYVESQGRVILQWDEVSKADHYTIEKNGQLLPGKFRATSHYDDDVEKNTRYEYRITAYSGDGAVLAVMRAATG